MPSRVNKAPLFGQMIPFKPSKGALRKGEIVEAAIWVIAHEGVDKLTFESVGKRSGIGKSHVAYHFPNRDEIVKAAIGYVYAVGQAIVVECLTLEKNPQKRLQAYIQGAFQWIESHPDHVAVMALLLSMGSVSKNYRKQQTEIRALGAARILSILQNMKITKRSARELVEISETIQVMILGNLMYYGAADIKLSTKELGDRTYQMSVKLLKA